MRLFYAIELAAPAKEQIYSRISSLRGAGVRGRFTRAENLHLTLRFLGECPAQWTAGFCALLNDAAAEIPAFDLRIQGTGTFGRGNDILWLGVKADACLERLAAKLNVNPDGINASRDLRKFQPHITIGRQVRFPVPAPEIDDGNEIMSRVEFITLMQSDRKNGKLFYAPVCRKQLLGKGGK